MIMGPLCTGLVIGGIFSSAAQIPRESVKLIASMSLCPIIDDCVKPDDIMWVFS